MRAIITEEQEKEWLRKTDPLTRKTVKRGKKQKLELKLPADYDPNWTIDQKIEYLRKIQPKKF